MDFRKYDDRSIRHLISAPFIYSVAVPIIILDLFAEIYHRVCFPLYGIKYVHRSKYVVIDRHKLSKLNIWEKLNCVYCGYVNGLLAYLVEIAGRTEKYWCGIKHQDNESKITPEHHKQFENYSKYL